MHPWCVHHLIQSQPFSAAWRLAALLTAQRYATVAPSVPHALHMPSHIFSMVGMWQESIKSNREALGVAKNYVHAMDFMVYAHLQLAQDGEAKRLWKRVPRSTKPKHPRLR